MKIVFVLPVVAQNGGNRVVATYAEKLLRRGHDVVVVSRYPEEQSWMRKLVNRAKGRLEKPDPNRTAFFDRLGDRHIQIPWKFPLDATDVPDADVVIATWWRTAFEVVALPAEKGRKVYFVQGHEVFPGTPWDIGAGSYYLPLAKITISSHLQSLMKRLYGDPGVTVVPNSVDTQQFSAPPRGKGTPPTVGLLYSSSPTKGVDISLKAIEIARRKIPDLRVLAFGHEKPGDVLPLPRGSRFWHRPAQSEIPKIYAQCDVWLCGSRSEGFHLPPLEAMACRTPVVTTRIGGAVETVTEGVNGHIVDVEDAEALGARLTDVLTLDPDVWRTWSDAAYDRARGYSWDDAAKDFDAALTRIAAQL